MNLVHSDNWISIQFGGDIPTIINGQITDLEEDMIGINNFSREDRKLFI